MIIFAWLNKDTVQSDPKDILVLGTPHGVSGNSRLHGVSMLTHDGVSHNLLHPLKGSVMAESLVQINPCNEWQLLDMVGNPRKSKYTH